MDINAIFNLLVLYILVVIFFYSCLASFSYAYYARKIHASNELQNRFQVDLKPPFKWLWFGKKPIIEGILLSTTNGNFKGYKDYIENAPLSLIKFYRISCTLLCFIPVLISLAFFVIPGQYLNVESIINVIVHIMTLFASFRFGHKFVSLSQNEILQ